jgi:mRNA-degrading endonuclease RelE of RelBE toxin-antitoxin system
MAYRIVLKPSADKAMDSLPKHAQVRVVDKMQRSRWSW